MIFELPEGMEEYTIKQLRNWFGFMDMLGEAAAMHAFVMLGDPDHDCDPVTESPITDAAPSFEMDDVKAFFAYETAMLQLFDTMRVVLHDQGFPVETQHRS